MTTHQISVIRRHIKENPEMNNSELARHMLEHSNLQLSEGSLKNYIGKVKSMPRKTVSTQVGHVMDEIEEKSPIKRAESKTKNTPAAPTKTREEIFTILFERHPDLSNLGLAQKIVEEKLITGLSVNSLSTYIGKFKRENPGLIKSSKNENVGVKQYPVEKKDAIKPFHEVLVIGSTIGFPTSSLNQYFYNMPKAGRVSVIAYGDDARTVVKEQMAGVDNYTGIKILQGGLAGLKERNALLDGIEHALVELMNSIDDCPDTDVNITIIADRPDFGSRTSTQENVAELINKVSRRFGWSVNLIYKGTNQEARKLASDLAIDSSNAIGYSYNDQVQTSMMEARLRKTRFYMEGERYSFNYFNTLEA